MFPEATSRSGCTRFALSSLDRNFMQMKSEGDTT